MSTTTIFFELPPLCKACSALLPAPITSEHALIAVCRKCGQNHVKFLPGWLPASEDLIGYFGLIVTALMHDHGHSFPTAVTLAKNYYRDFTDPTYCEAIGVPTQDEEFMFHEGLDMANRIQYYLVLRLDPDPGSYIQWRAQHNLDRKIT